MANNRAHWQTGVVGMIVGAALMGLYSHGEKAAQAEVRRTTPTDPEQHFKSGGRLAEGVLQEILVVLKRMDERLERIETSDAFTSQRSPQRPVMQPNTNAPQSLRDGPEIKIKRAR